MNGMVRVQKKIPDFMKVPERELATSIEPGTEAGLETSTQLYRAHKIMKFKVEMRSRYEEPTELTKLLSLLAEVVETPLENLALQLECPVEGVESIWSDILAERYAYPSTAFELVTETLMPEKELNMVVLIKCIYYRCAMIPKV